MPKGQQPDVLWSGNLIQDMSAISFNLETAETYNISLSANSKLIASELAEWANYYHQMDDPYAGSPNRVLFNPLGRFGDVQLVAQQWYIGDYYNSTIEKIKQHPDVRYDLSLKLKSFNFE